MTTITKCQVCAADKRREHPGHLAFVCDDCILNRGQEALKVLQDSVVKDLRHPMFIRVARETVTEGVK